MRDDYQVASFVLGILVGIALLLLGIAVVESFSVESVCVTLQRPPAERLCECRALACPRGGKQKYECHCSLKKSLDSETQCLDEEIHLRVAGMVWKFDSGPRSFSVDD